ncbi:protein-export chaperone SecB [Candidatus Pelagibacter communis]|uniref:protein-export chaperone SecB n=1 Tax=Pelagibacter ubique TaxID=198252 RepID=UPI000B2A3AFA|nr:protein-export chaperone SecB [Candidatus Pelagibacter ubique]
MTKNYKILTTFVKDVLSKIQNIESYLYLKDNIPKYTLNIDINSIPLKNNMAEVDVKLTFDDKSKKDNKGYFEMTHATIVRVEQEAVNKNELQKIFLRDVPTDVYPEIEKIFLEIVKSIGYPDLKLEKKINFVELFEKNMGQK